MEERMREGDGGTKRGKEERREPERSRVTSYYKICIMNARL